MLVVSIIDVISTVLSFLLTCVMMSVADAF